MNDPTTMPDARETRLPVEFRAVAAACAVFSDDAMRQPLHALLASADGDRMLRIARRHRVEALALRGMGDDARLLPELARKRWSEVASRQAFSALAMATESVRLARQLHAAGIDAVFLKGSPLALLAFGDLTLRHAKDVDILIPADRIAVAERTLREAGYIRIAPPENSTADDVATWRSRSKDTKWLQRRALVEVELHWSLADSGPDETPAAADLQWVQLGSGQQLLTQRDDLLLRYLCLHGASHAWSRLKWLADVHALLVKAVAAAPAQLFTDARAGRERRAVAQALLLCQMLFGWRLDADLVKTLRAEPRVILLVRIALAVMTSGAAEGELNETAFASSRVYLSRLLLASNMAELLREARLSLLPAEEAMAARTAGVPFALAPAVRIWKWASKHLARGMWRT